MTDIRMQAGMSFSAALADQDLRFISEGNEG